MYGSENWSLNQSDKRNIEAAEMRFLRPTAGYKLLDRKRSSDIREQLDVFNINDKLTQNTINWKEHIQRMDDNRLPQKIKLQTWREKKYRKTTNEMGRFSGGRNRPKGLSLIVDEIGRAHV